MMHQNHLTPIHAGKVLQDELEEIDISSDTLAKHIGVSPIIIDEICEGKKDITAPLAMKLSRALGASPQFWLNLQNNWELSQVNESDYQDIKSIAA
jgi:addiction module HigA family antidote